MPNHQVHQGCHDTNRVGHLLLVAITGLLLLGSVGELARGNNPELVQQEAPVYDLCLQGAEVIDGTGAPRYQANLYIHQGHIVKLTAPDIQHRAARVIKAEGQVVTPGFIDTHAHGDPVRTPFFGNFMAMGVTTLCLGLDGDSPADPASWFRQVEKLALGPNVSLLIGHGTVRNEAGVLLNPNPTPQQIEAMRQLVEQGMQAGCLGLSSGLEYQPGSFARLDELVAIARPVGQAGGLLMSHLRSEDDDAITAALAEFLEQGKLSNTPVHVSHLKVTYGRGTARAEQLLEQMAAARRQGQRVTADLYPYLASYTGIGIVFPSWAKPPHDYAEVVRTRREELAAYLRKRIGFRNGPTATLLATPPWTGKTLAQVAELRKQPFEDVLIDELGPNRARGAYFIMDEALQERLLIDPHVMICSDGSPTMNHPRGYGAFTRVLRKYVREKKLLTLEGAIHKMTGLAATTTGLDRTGRGRIAPGYVADLLIFDPQQVQDHATYEQPHRHSSGIDWVLVNGQVVIEQGQPTGARTGRVLKRKN